MRYASALTSPIITVTPGTRTQTPTPGASSGLCGDPEMGGLRLAGSAGAAVSSGVATSDDEDFDQVSGRIYS